MHATYDPGLPTNKDWVRFLVGDKMVASARFEDAEIEALLAAEASNGQSGGQSSQVYLAAARAIEILYATWQTSTGGIIETQIGGLRLKRGDGESSSKAVAALVKNFRAKGAELLMGRPRMFRAL